MSYELNDAEFSLYSDMHKDAHGFRPRIVSLIKFDSKESFDAEIDFLQTMIEEQILETELRENSAYDKWIAGVHKTARDLSATVAQVVRWQFDAESLRLREKQDREAFCYSMGFAFHMQELIGKIR